MLWLWVPIYGRECEEFQRDLALKERTPGSWDVPMALLMESSVPSQGFPISFMQSPYCCMLTPELHAVTPGRCRRARDLPNTVCGQAPCLLERKVCGVWILNEETHFSPSLSQGHKLQRGEILSFLVFSLGVFSAQYISWFWAPLWSTSLSLYR